MIWAQGHNRAIGAAGQLPWHLPEDLAIFKRATMGCPVIMGRRTWESLNERYRPLPGRQNIVLTGDGDYVAPGALVASTVDQALEMAGSTVADREDAAGGGSAVPEAAAGRDRAAQLGRPRYVWVIGGATVYGQALDRADLLVVTDVDVEVPEADAFAPAVDFGWKLAEALPERGWLTSRTGLRYRCSVYARPGAELPPLLGAA